MSAVPDSVVPDCVTTHVISSGLNESDPMPVHVPLATTGAEVDGGGTTGAGAGAAGLGAVVSAGAMEPHAASHAASAPVNAMLLVLICRRRSEERRVGKECKSRWSP